MFNIVWNIYLKEFIVYTTKDNYQPECLGEGSWTLVNDENLGLIDAIVEVVTCAKSECWKNFDVKFEL